VGPEFFDVAAHPTAVFAAAIRREGEGYLAEGTLTLRGVEKPLTLPFTLALEGESARMEGRVSLDRRDFGIGAAYPDEGSVGFAVEVAVSLTALRQ
jgi:polyisoprenoid-binding protein YceI